VEEVSGLPTRWVVGVCWGLPGLPNQDKRKKGEFDGEAREEESLAGGVCGVSERDGRDVLGLSGELCGWAGG